MKQWHYASINVIKYRPRIWFRSVRAPPIMLQRFERWDIWPHFYLSHFEVLWFQNRATHWKFTTYIGNVDNWPNQFLENFTPTSHIFTWGESAKFGLRDALVSKRSNIPDIQDTSNLESVWRVRLPKFGVVGLLHPTVRTNGFFGREVSITQPRILRVHLNSVYWCIIGSQRFQSYWICRLVHYGPCN